METFLTFGQWGYWVIAGIMAVGYVWGLWEVSIEGIPITPGDTVLGAVIIFTPFLNLCVLVLCVGCLIKYVISAAFPREDEE